MQDGASNHTSQWQKPLFTQHCVNILDWPGNSPDLNPIEHIWSLIKDRVAARRPFIKGKEALGLAWLEEWENLDIQKDINPFINNQWRRCTQVLEHNGGNNFYG